MPTICREYSQWGANSKALQIIIWVPNQWERNRQQDSLIKIPATLLAASPPTSFTSSRWTWGDGSWALRGKRERYILIKTADGFVSSLLPLVMRQIAATVWDKQYLAGTRKENQPETDAILGQSKKSCHQSITWTASLFTFFLWIFFFTLRGDHTESCRQVVAAY